MCITDYFIVYVFLTIIVCAMAQVDVTSCPDMKSPRNFDLSQIMGLYYVVEIVLHRDDPRHRGINVVDSCPLVRLSRVDGSHMLKLLWSEEAGNVEYHFSIPDLDTPGYWMSFGPQNGSMLQQPYKQFAGTVQVMKTAPMYTVLTFCSPNSDLHSVVLSRERKMKRGELKAITTMLEGKNLQPIGIKQACRDGSVSVTSSIVLLLTALFICAIR